MPGLLAHDEARAEPGRGRAEREHGGQPAAVGDSAGRDDRRGRHRIHDGRHERQRRDRPQTWPPASQPWAMTTSTPAATCWRASSSAAGRRRDEGSGAINRSDVLCRVAPEREMNRTPSSSAQATRSACGRLEVEVEAGRSARQALRLAHRPTRLVALGGAEGKHAEAAGVRDGGREPRVGESADRCLDDRVVDSEQAGEGRLHGRHATPRATPLGPPRSCPARRPGADLCSQPVGRGVVAGCQTVEPQQRGTEHRRRVEHGDLGGRCNGPDELGHARHEQVGRATGEPPASVTGTGSSSRLRRRIEAVANAASSSAMSRPGPAPPRPRRGRPWRRPAPAPPLAGPRSCRGRAPRSRRPGSRGRSGRARAWSGWSPAHGRRPPGRPRPGPHPEPGPPAAIAGDLAQAAEPGDPPVGRPAHRVHPGPADHGDPPAIGRAGSKGGEGVVEQQRLPGQPPRPVRLREALPRPPASPSRPGRHRELGHRSLGPPGPTGRPRRGAGRRARTAGPAPARGPPPGARSSARGPRAAARRGRAQRDVRLRVAAVDGEDERPSRGEPLQLVDPDERRPGRPQPVDDRGQRVERARRPGVEQDDGAVPAAGVPARASAAIAAPVRSGSQSSSTTSAAMSR